MNNKQIELLKSALDSLAYFQDRSSPDYNRVCDAQWALSDIKAIEDSKGEQE